MIIKPSAIKTGENRMIKLGILGPSESEIMPFISKLSNVGVTEYAMLKFYSGSYDGISVVSLYSGVCKVNAAIATQLLITKFDVTHVILTGVAGALKSNINIGDIIVSSEIAYHDVNPEILTEYHPRMKDNYFRSDLELLKMCKSIVNSSLKFGNYYFGKIITGESFITENERDDLIRKYDPLCVDMESASVAHTCYVNSVPFIVIRSITDNADENGSSSFEENVELASLNALNFVEKLISRFKNL